MYFVVPDKYCLSKLVPMQGQKYIHADSANISLHLCTYYLQNHPYSTLMVKCEVSITSALLQHSVTAVMTKTLGLYFIADSRQYFLTVKEIFSFYGKPSII